MRKKGWEERKKTLRMKMQDLPIDTEWSRKQLISFWNVLFARDNLIKSQTYSHIEKCGQPIVLPPNDQGNREIGA